MTAAITVENLSKAYRIGVKEEIPDTLASAASTWVRAPLHNLRKLARLNTFAGNENETDLHWALKDVSFEVEEGEVVGIIGRNGAGKSTLLKILSRITQPTSGHALIRGRVSSLLEVGTGFHPEMSGRENVYMNGTILGMRKKEIDRKFNEIVEFSGVEKFLDTPVKRYSSGMKVRLAFAVAAHLEPEILVIDEVLAVGDMDFQRKCLGKMESVAKSGRTVLFVSHNIAAVENLCTTGLLLEKGRVALRGDIRSVLEAYSNQSRNSVDSRNLGLQQRPNGLTPLLQKLLVLDMQGNELNEVPTGKDFVIKIEGLAEKNLSNVIIGLAFKRTNGDRVFTCNSSFQHSGQINLEGQFSTAIKFTNFRVSPGDYMIDINVVQYQTLLDMVENVPFHVGVNDLYGTGKILPQKSGIYLPDVAWNSKTTL